MIWIIAFLIFIFAIAPSSLRDKFITLIDSFIGNMRSSLNLIVTKSSIGGVKPNDNARSPQWPGVRARHLKDHPVCEVCQSKNKLEVHHIKPFHLQPELELQETNLITLCESEKYVNCHLFVGHLGNFKSYNVDVVSNATEWNKKILNRPK